MEWKCNNKTITKPNINICGQGICTHIQRDNCEYHIRKGNSHNTKHIFKTKQQHSHRHIHRHTERQNSLQKGDKFHTGHIDTDAAYTFVYKH